MKRKKKEKRKKKKFDRTALRPTVWNSCYSLGWIYERDAKIEQNRKAERKRVPRATRAKNQLRKVRGKSELDGLRDNSLVLPLVSPFEFASIGETDRLSVNSAPSIENKIGHFFFRSIINCPDFQFVENDKKKTIDPSIIVFSRRCMGF